MPASSMQAVYCTQRCPMTGNIFACTNSAFFNQKSLPNLRHADMPGATTSLKMSLIIVGDSKKATS